MPPAVPAALSGAAPSREGSQVCGGTARRHPAWVDCERIRPGPIAQPVNTASSVGFCLAGAHLIARAENPDPVRVRAMRAYGVVLVATGIGSCMFHGPGGPLSQWMHDAPILGLTSGIAAWDAYDLGLVSGRTAAAAAGAVTATGAALMVGSVARGMPLQVLCVVAGLGLEAAIRIPWTGAGSWRDRLPVRDRHAERASAVVLAVGAAMHPLGRTGSPLCRPDSRVQLHSAWHLGAAAATGLWAWAAMGPSTRSAPSVARRRAGRAAMPVEDRPAGAEADRAAPMDRPDR